MIRCQPIVAGLLLPLILTAACTPSPAAREPAPGPVAARSAARRDPPPRESVPGPPPASLPALPESLIERPEFALSIGDRLSIRFVPRPRDAAPRDYRLSPGDQLQLRFPLESRYDQQPVIQPDGRIRLIHVGPLRAAGLTLEQLGEQVRVAYARYLREPELTLDLKARDPRIDEIRRALAAESRPMPVKSDGTIDLPYLGQVRAVGKSIESLRLDLDRLCADAGLEDVAASVVVDAFAPRRLFVTGEVRTPGMLAAEAPTSLLQAIAASGGITPAGDPHRVLLVRRLGLPQPGSVVIDVQRLLDAALSNAGRPLPPRFDPWLADGDILYVPPRQPVSSVDSPPDQPADK